MRVAMDETAAEPGAAGSGAADAVCLKIARCGGISGVLRDAAAARAAGSEVYVASSFDGPLGVAAGVHAAAALAAGGGGGVLPCGLATLGAFAGLEEVLPARGGVVAVPSGPGLLGWRAGLVSVMRSRGLGANCGWVREGESVVRVGAGARSR